MIHLVGQTPCSDNNNLLFTVPHLVIPEPGALTKAYRCEHFITLTRTHAHTLTKLSSDITPCSKL